MEEKIQKILENNRRYARYENCGHEVVDEHKAVKDLTNLLQAEKEPYLDEQGKTWYFEGDELVIKKGKWVIDRYKKRFKKESV